METHLPLHNLVMIKVGNGGEISRANIIWNFYCASKSAGSAPFVVTCPRDGKAYLRIFPEEKPSYMLNNAFLDYKSA